MFIIEQYSTAVIFCMVTMLCWGSWANTQKLAASTWRFELYYWDYVLGIVLMSALFAFTIGSIGEGGRRFLADVQQADSSNLGSAVLGGVIFNAANILLGAAISIAGMSVAFPVGIGLALVIGVVVNYIQQPLGDERLLFLGIALIVVAIVLNAIAYKRLATGTGVSVRGLLLSVVSGCMMGLFYKYVAASMFPDFHTPVAGKLSPYTAIVAFALGILISNFLFNSYLMARPFVGEPVTYRDYLSGSLRSHATGVVGGGIWCIGMAFSIIASGKAGPAISYGLGQGATVVAALWGIFIWKEFRSAPKGTNTLLYGMLVAYLLGLTLIILAR